MTTSNIEHHIRLAAEKAKAKLAEKTQADAKEQKDTEEWKQLLTDKIKAVAKSLQDIAVVVAEAAGARHRTHPSFMEAMEYSIGRPAVAKSGTTWQRSIEATLALEGNTGKPPIIELRVELVGQGELKTFITAAGYGGHGGLRRVILKDEAEFARWIGEYIALTAETSGPRGETGYLFAEGWDK
jgi:hypothetical protein